MKQINTMNKFITINIIWFIATIAINAQSLKNENTHNLLDSLASFDRIAIDAVGPQGSINKQYEFFTKLLESNGTENLVKLFEEQKDAIVKCYLFWGLAKKQYPDLFELLTKNLFDNRSVTVVIGNFVEDYKVSDFLINVMTEDRIDIDAKKLDDENRMQLDSILIFNDSIRLQAKTELLQKYTPVNNQYKKIKELANNSYSPFAYVALAKFRKEEDISIINQLFDDSESKYYGLLAVRAFNSPIFYDKVITAHNEILESKKLNYSLIRAVYQALVQYPTEQTVNQLKIGLKKTRGYARKTHERYIWLAIDKYPNEIFESVKSEIEFTELDLVDLENERNF